MCLKQFSDDPPLSKARSDYATEVAPFVSALKRAEDLEERGQTGAGLAWYLKSWPDVSSEHVCVPRNQAVGR